MIGRSRGWKSLAIAMLTACATPQTSGETHQPSTFEQPAQRHIEGGPAVDSAAPLTASSSSLGPEADAGSPDTAPANDLYFTNAPTVFFVENPNWGDRTLYLDDSVAVPAGVQIEPVAGLNHSHFMRASVRIDGKDLKGWVLFRDVDRSPPPPSESPKGGADLVLFGGTSWCGMTGYGGYEAALKQKAYACLNEQVARDPRFRKLPSDDRRSATKSAEIVREEKITTSGSSEVNFIVIAGIPRNSLVPHVRTATEVASDRQAARAVAQTIALLNKGRCPKGFRLLQNHVCFRPLPTEVVEGFAVVSGEIVSTFSMLSVVVGLELEGDSVCSDEPVLTTQPGHIMRLRYPCTPAAVLPPSARTTSYIIVKDAASP